MSKNDLLLVSLSRTLRTGPKFMTTLDWKPEPNDVIIPLMGPTGVGKSTFINSIAGKKVTTVGEELKSCTAKLLPVAIGSLQSDLLKDGRLVLVDTPGFDDTNVKDADILRNIASWLETTYDSQETKLAGIVYLYDISLTRSLGSTRKNLDIFQKLCGEDALKRVVLCTTKWSDICQADGERRTEQLEKSYWKEMAEGGSAVHKFEDSQKSAWDVIVPIIKEDRFKKIKEDLEKLIPDTEEGLQLRDTLDQLLKSLQQASSNDFLLRKELDDQIAATRLQIGAIAVTPGILGLLDFVDKIIKFIFPPSPSRGNKLSDAKELIMLFGETETSYKRLLELSAAKITNFGSDEQATTEVRCWSVREDSKPLYVVAAPSFDSHQGDDPAIFEKVRIWLRRLCHEEMRFGTIFLNPSPSHAGPALKLVQKSDGFRFRALFATFDSKAKGTAPYQFDASVASFQETSEQALEMFKIARSNLVDRKLLLEELQKLSKGGEGK